MRTLSEAPVAAVCSRFPGDPADTQNWLETRERRSGALHGSAEVELPTEPFERAAFLIALWRQIAAADETGSYNIFVNLGGWARITGTFALGP